MARAFCLRFPQEMAMMVVHPRPTTELGNECERSREYGWNSVRQQDIR